MCPTDTRKECVGTYSKCVSFADGPGPSKPSMHSPIVFYLSQSPRPVSLIPRFPLSRHILRRMTIWHLAVLGDERGIQRAARAMGIRSPWMETKFPGAEGVAAPVRSPLCCCRKCSRGCE